MTASSHIGHEPSASAPRAARRPGRRLALGLAGIATLMLAGCVIAPVDPGTYGSVEGPVVEAAPPPARYEVVPVAPGPAYVWIGGYWAWQLGRHVWVGGHWAVPPAGRNWAPGYWGHEPRGWRWHGGYWRGR